MKAIAYARLAGAGKVFGDQEINQIAGKIHLLEMIRKKLNGLSMSDAVKVDKILSEMNQITNFVWVL